MARNEYFYLPADHCPAPGDETAQPELVLPDGEHRHLAKVLRHAAGDTVFVTCGDGRVFECTIESVAKNHTKLCVSRVHFNRSEPQFKLTIAQAVPKLNRFEWFLEKAVEIGAFEIWPMQTEFTEISPTKKKTERWRKIMIAAMKQCGRSYLPNLAPIQTFDEILAQSHNFTHRWIAHAATPDEQKKSLQFNELKTGQNGLVLIGPQGGFSAAEIQKAITAGWRFLTLGPTRLRSETAGVIAAAIILNQHLQ